MAELIPLLADVSRNLQPWLMYGAKTAAQIQALRATVQQAKELYGNAEFTVWELKSAAESLDHELGNPSKHILRTLEGVITSANRGYRVSTGGIWDDQGYDVSRVNLSGNKRSG